MRKSAVQSILALGGLTLSTSAALADIPPEPDPTDPMIFVLAIVGAVATGIGYYIRSLRRR